MGDDRAAADCSARLGLLSVTGAAPDVLGRVVEEWRQAPGVVGAAAFEGRSPDLGPLAASFPGGCLVVLDLAPGAGVEVGLGEADGHLTVACHGVFEHISTHRRVSGPPDPLGAPGILVAMLDNGRPDDDAAFNRWYDDEHAVDVTRAGGFEGATRYRMVLPGRGGLHRFLALYESSRPDAEIRQQAVIEARAHMVLWSAIEHVVSGAYARLPL